MKLISRTPIRLTLGFLLFASFFSTAALAGPPLICHPI